jgi:hypothetical protein
MNRACHGPMRAATGDAFSDEELDDVLSRLESRFRKAKGQAPGEGDRAAMAQAAAEMTREAVMEALIKRRLEAAQARAAARADEIVAALPGDEGDRLRAYSVGTEKQAAFSGFSVDAEARARTTQLWSMVETGLRGEPGLIDRASNFIGFGEGGFDRKVARELARLSGAAVEATGDEGAEITARVFRQAQDAARKGLNDAGAWVGQLDGYIARQGHDRLKVSGGFWRELRAAGAGAVTDWSAASLVASRKAFREWHDFIRPRLDDRTFDKIDLEDVTLSAETQALHAAGVLADAADLKERFLYHAWFNIVTGANDTLTGAGDIGEFRPPASKARAVSKARVLHFKGPDDWMDYHERFGRGSLFGVVMQGLARDAQNAALMQRFGPSPDAGFEALRGRLSTQARARGDDAAARKLDANMRAAEFGELTGEANRPDNLRMALVFRTIRLDQSLSKLGGMVLSSLSDTALAAQTHARAGGSFLDGYAAAFKGITRLQGEAGREAADLLDVGARSAAAHLTGRFMASDGPLGWGAWASRLFYKVNLFEFWADGLRRGMAEMLAAHLGRQSARPWGGITAGTRETLERFGLDEGAWELLRRGSTRADDGRTYLTFEALDQVTDAELLAWKGVTGKQATPEAAARARGDLDIRLRALVQNTLDDALTEARARERVGLTRGLKPGTVFGEAARTFTQFWSFNQAMMGRHVAPAARGFAGKSPVALLAHLIIATSLMGYASLQAKQMVKGRTPRDPEDAEGVAKLWMASLLQGGGLGIYGDFLFGEYNRHGKSLWATMAGPAVGELESLGQIVKAAGSGEVEDLPAETVRFGVRNTPFVNLWYSRLVLDYLVLWRLQEAVSPGYLDRMARREEQAGSQFWIDPTEAVQ